jgi:hypothetical protein
MPTLSKVQEEPGATIIPASVTSLNGEKGAVNITAGASIAVTPAGQNIAISASVYGSYDFLVYYDGAFYRAVNWQGTLVYGGSGAQGGIAGVTADTIYNACIVALPTSRGGWIVTKASATNYNLAAVINSQNVNNVRLTFEGGSVLFEGSLLGNQGIKLSAVSGWIIEGGELNGNGANQSVNTNANGIEINNSTSCLVQNMYIHNWGKFGGAIYNVSDYCGFQNNLLTYNAWNGLNLGNHPTDTNNFAFFNEVAHSSDVGIANFGTNGLCNGNFIHDMDGTTGSSNNSVGITIENGGGNAFMNTVSNNKIMNIKYTGIYIMGSVNENTIIGNSIYTWDTPGTYQPGINIQGNRNNITGNLLYSITNHGEGIQVTSGGTYNLIQGNYITTPQSVCITISSTSPSNEILNNSCHTTGGYGQGIAVTSGCLSNIIAGNDVRDCTTPIADGSLVSIIYNNLGYNPVGSIATPWPASTGNLTDSAAAQNNPTSATLYTVTQSPKRILLTNCAGVTQVQINGVTLVNVTTQTEQSYLLYPGETINVTWSVTTPNGQILAL